LQYGIEANTNYGAIELAVLLGIKSKETKRRYKIQLQKLYSELLAEKEEENND